MESWDVVFFGEGADLSSKEKSQKGIPKPNPSGFDSFKGVSHPWKNIVTCFFPTISSNLKRCCVWFMFLLENPTHSNKKKTTPRFSPWICQLADLQLLLMLLDQGSKKFTKLSYLDGWKDHWPTREECFFWVGMERKPLQKGKLPQTLNIGSGCFWWVVFEVWTYRWTKFVSRSFRCKFLPSFWRFPTPWPKKIAKNHMQLLHDMICLKRLV